MAGYELLTNGEPAAEAARILTETTGKKHQVRPVVDQTWIQREQARFDTGHYERLPWTLFYLWKEGIDGDKLFAHVSKTSPGKVAFTESPEKGAADRQTVISPGKFLERYTTLGADKIKSLANEFTARYADSVLKFATTADEIESVYVNGPSSCLAYKACHFETDGTHPARVYAAGDLAVAYTIPIDAEECNKISERCLCWPAKKIYGRIYGESGRLANLLANEGYSPGKLDGARLLKLRNDMDDYIMPYIDYAGCSDNGDHFIIQSHGDYHADNTNGLLEERNRVMCDHCGDTVHDENTRWIEGNDETWCESCADDYSFVCESNGRRYHNDNAVLMASGAYWCDSAFERYGFTCEGNGENYHADDMVVLADGTVWSQDYFMAHGRECDGCGECMQADETCESCAPDETETESEAA